MTVETSANGSPTKPGDAEVTAAGRAGATPLSAPGGLERPGDSRAAQRNERRDERAAAREARHAGRDKSTRMSPAERQGRLALRETVSVGLLAMLAGGALVGAILGAVGAPGWVVGLLVAGLTAILSAKLRRA